jgi:hypothetical protein
MPSMGYTWLRSGATEEREGEINCCCGNICGAPKSSHFQTFKSSHFQILFPEIELYLGENVNSSSESIYQP